MKSLENCKCLTVEGTIGIHDRLSPFAWQLIDITHYELNMRHPFVLPMVGPASNGEGIKEEIIFSSMF